MTRKKRATYGVAIADTVSARLGLPKLIGRKFINAYFDEITEQIIEGAETITIKGVGTIKLGYLAKKKYFHPASGEYMQCPARYRLNFSFSKHYQRELDKVMKKVIDYDKQKNKRGSQ